MLLLCLLAISHLASAQGFLKVDGSRIINEKGENVILRGMGLGGWMLQEGYMLRVRGIGQQQHVIRQNLEALIGREKTEEFYNAWLANHTRRIDIDSMARWGFNSVRLPMHYNLYTLSAEEEPIAGQPAWLTRGFSMTDSLLAWCAANKMYLILDLHGAPGGQGNDNNISDRDPSKPSLWEREANQQKTIALWRKLAERYKDEPWIGGYDIINEPNWGFENVDDKNGCNEQTNAPLRKLMMDITAAIRETDKKHMIIIEGNCWGNNYSGVLPPWDNNTVISFHKYWNYNDVASIQKFIDIRKQYNTPVWLGETGENSNGWFRDAVHLMESNNIGWAWWPLKKLGHNNPLQVKMPANYKKIIDYWAKEGPRPTVEEASQGVMEFANNLKLENCIYHPDVVDALFRQPHTNETRPFKKHEAKAGLVIPAVDFDLGRNGFAYHDKDTGNYWVANGGQHSTGNKGNTYRNDGVDVYEIDGKLMVDHIEPGEWLQYTIAAGNVEKYSLSLTTWSTVAAKLVVEINGKPIHVTSPGSTTWQPVQAGRIALRKGANTIRVKAIDGGWKLHAIQLN